MFKYWVNFLLFIFISFNPFNLSAKTALESVSASITVTHITSENWIVDYRFNKPIEAMIVGPKVVKYRQTSWQVLTPDIALIESGDGEKLISKTGTFSSLKIKISHYSDFAMDDYAPSAKFSDGGVALYTEFLFGDVVAAGLSHKLNPSLEFKTKLNEHIITHAKINDGRGVYTYFGPQKMKRSGDVDLIVDPNMPKWLEDSFNKVVPLVSKIYSQRLNRTLTSPPQVMLSAGDIDSIDSFSVKGGAKNNQLVMIYKGKDLLEPSAEKQHMLERLIAHEMAHLWQQDVKNGGMSAEEPWIHEGGAEALAVAALVEAKLWKKDYSEKYSRYYIKRCRDILGKQTLKAKIEQGNWDAVYACGFKYFAQSDADLFQLWSYLIESADHSGKHFSSEMLEQFNMKEK